jgi:hypothetical protein
MHGTAVDFGSDWILRHVTDPRRLASGPCVVSSQRERGRAESSSFFPIIHLSIYTSLDHLAACGMRVTCDLGTLGEGVDVDVAWCCEED